MEVCLSDPFSVDILCLLSSESISWILTKDSGLRHVDVFKWVEPKSVRFIVYQLDRYITCLQFKDPTVFNNNGLLCRFSLCCSGIELLAGEALVRNDNVGTQGVVDGGGEVQIARIECQTAKLKVMIFC